MLWSMDRLPSQVRTTDASTMNRATAATTARNAGQPDNSMNQTCQLMAGDHDRPRLSAGTCWRYFSVIRRGPMAHTYEELKKKTVAELRDIAKDIEHEAVQGFTQMNKDHLLPAICKALGIEA